MSQESRKAGMLLRDSEITESIIAAAIAVHRELGPGFLESVYEQALAVEFAIRGTAFVRQKAIPLFYRDHQIGEHRLDFVVEGKIIVGIGEGPLRDRPQLPKGRHVIGRTNLKFFVHAIDG